MKSKTFLLAAVAPLAGLVVLTAPASPRGHEGAAPRFVTRVPSGYRDWRLISVAREEGTQDDIRAILGNDRAIQGLSGRKASVSGRHNCRSHRLEL